MEQNLRDIYGRRQPFKKGIKFSKEGKIYTDHDAFMKYPGEVEEVDIVVPPCTIDYRLNGYKGVYNRVGQGQINDPCGKIKGNVMGYTENDLLDIDEQKFFKNRQVRNDIDKFSKENVEL